MSDPIPVPPVAPKRRGRPSKVQQEMADLRALLASMQAKLQEAHTALAQQQDGGTTVVLTPEEKRRLEWEDYSRRSEAWQATQPAACPVCGQVAGYNPVTGVEVRQYAGRVRIDGHRDSCPVKAQAAVKLTR